jgi:hypothetical protein
MKMDSSDERRASEQRNTTGGGGIIITGGTFSGSSVTAVSGSGNSAVVQSLTGELARIGQLLHAAAPGENQDLIRARAEVAKLQDELAADNRDQARPQTASLRQRVTALIAVLAPVAEVIGGVAALQAIVAHL